MIKNLSVVWIVMIEFVSVNVLYDVKKQTRIHFAINGLCSYRFSAIIVNILFNSIG